MEHGERTVRQNKNSKGWLDCCSIEEQDGMDQALDKIRSTKLPASNSKVQESNNVGVSTPATTNQASFATGLNKLKLKRSLHQQSFDRSDSNKISAYAAAVMVRNEQPLSVSQLPQHSAANFHTNSTTKLHFNYVQPQKIQTVIPPQRISEVEDERDTSLHYLNLLNNKKETVTSIQFDSRPNLSRKSIVQTSVKETSYKNLPNNKFAMREVISILDPSAIQNMESVIIGRGPARRNT